MGEDVSYQSGSWDDMGRAIVQISGWGGALERMQRMDRTLQQIQKAIDDLDEDRRLWFSYKSQAGALDKLGDDYQKLGTFTGEAGNAVSRHIDDPFYKQMDAFAAEMAQVSISQYHTPNTLNVKEYQAASPLASVAAYEPVTKQSITFDDLFNSSSLMAASLKKEYETYRAAAGKQAGGVTFDQYKEGIQYSRGFDYRSIKDKQMDQEFWVNLGIGAAIVILTIACPAGITAGAAYGAMQLTDAATGTNLISGRKLSTEERVTEGVFGVLDVIPAFKAAGAFSAIGRMGTKGVTTLGGLTKTMGRASGRRLLELKQVSRAGLDSVKQAVANAGDRIFLGGLQPEFAGASGDSAGGGESLIQDVKNTFQKIAFNDGIKKASKVDSKDITKNNNQMEINKRYSDIERFRERMGYGKYSSDSGNTVACIKINDETFYGVNSSISYESKMKTIQMRRKWFKEISWAPPKAVKPKHLGYTQSLSHAEAHSLLQAYEKLGKMPSRVTMYVDRPTCGICLGELPIILRHIGVKELIVYSGGRNEPVIIKAIK